MGIGRGNHPNSRANLKCIKPGEARNPQGSSAKVRERKENRRRIEEMAEKYEIPDYENYSQESRAKWFEFMRSLPPREFAKVASDPDMPLGAVVDAKALKTDYTEGTSYNTDRIERQIYGNKGNVNLSGEVGGGGNVDAIGFVFGGQEVDEDE